MSNVTQKFLGYFPEMSANKRKDISPQEFLHIHRDALLSLCQTKLPQGSSDILTAGAKSGLRALLNSWSPCMR